MGLPDPIDFPDSWLAVLHPRRGGRRGWFYDVNDESAAEYDAFWSAQQDQVEQICAHAGSDPRLVARVRAGGSDVATLGLLVTLQGHLFRGRGVQIADWCVRRAGLNAAIEGCLASLTSALEYSYAGGSLGYALTEPAPEGTLEWIAYRVPTTLFDHLRRLLSVAPEPEWSSAAAAAEPYRAGTWAQRLSTAFLFPDRHDWVAQDLAEMPRHVPYGAHFELAALSGFEPQQTARSVSNDLATLVTMIDGVGHGATPALFRSFDWYYSDVQGRQRILDVITHLSSEEIVTGLLERVRLADVPEAFETIANREPDRALGVLQQDTDNPFTAALLTRHLRSFPHLGERDVPDLPLAGVSEVPSVLTSPPWTRPKPKPVVVANPDLGITVEWADEAERQEWLWDRWPTFEATHYDDELARRPDSARFYLGGSEAAVRPRLATWEAEKSSFYLENPRLLVGKYELDAYPAVLRLARSKPVIGAELLLPFLSADAAVLMGTWLATSRRFRSVAQQWFDRHGVRAVMPLIPLALGKPTAQGRIAAIAVDRVDPDVVRAAGVALDCLDQVEALLARDPLDLVAGKVPDVPSWLDVEVLSPILTGESRRPLASDEVRILIRLLAISQLADPYAGLEQIAAACDESSLAEFVWRLFCEWHFAGRPSKDVWALDALGHFGDATVAARLAPLVRQWPSDGAAQRAKRGAEVLGIIDAPEALQELSVIARNARSTPLRKHAEEVLDRAAAARGLLPEQLEDLLAPDLGVDSVVEHAGIAYTVKLDVAARALELRAPDGSRVAALPKTSTGEDKAVASAWKRQQRSGKAAILDQARRLEQAMILQRTWTRPEFAASIAGHALLSGLARHLVWRVADQLVTVDALGDLVDIDGALVLDGDRVCIAHPATSDLTAWRSRWSSRSMAQPFSQLDRAAYDGDPSQHWGDTVTAASLYALVDRGWHWGATGRAATRGEILRPLANKGVATLRFTPGLSAVRNAAHEPDQTIESLTLHSPEHDDLAVFADLPRVTRSELLRDLAELVRRPGADS